MIGLWVNTIGLEVEFFRPVITRRPWGLFRFFMLFLFFYMYDPPKLIISQVILEGREDTHKQL